MLLLSGEGCAGSRAADEGDGGGGGGGEEREGKGDFVMMMGMVMMMVMVVVVVMARNVRAKVFHEEEEHGDDNDHNDKIITMVPTKMTIKKIIAADYILEKM